MANAFGESAGSLAADVDEARIAGDLIERRQGALRLGQQFVIEVGFELQQSVVDAEAVVLHAALEQGDKFLLARETFENLHQLRGGGVQRVIEFRFVDFGAFFPTEGFFAEIRDTAMDVEVLSLKILQIGGQFEHFAAQWGAHLKRQGSGVFIELADFEGGRVGIVMDDDLNELGRAGFEDAAIGKLGVYRGW